MLKKRQKAIEGNNEGDGMKKGVALSDKDGIFRVDGISLTHKDREIYSRKLKLLEIDKDGEFKVVLHLKRNKSGLLTDGGKKQWRYD